MLQCPHCACSQSLERFALDCLRDLSERKSKTGARRADLERINKPPFSHPSVLSPKIRGILGTGH
jgi:hypothetical protein